MDPLLDSLSNLIDRARSGDPIDAMEVLKVAALVLRTADIHGRPMNRHPRTGEPLPVPDVLRDYLADAAQKIAFGDVAPSVALNLARQGPRKLKHLHRALLADLTAQIIEEGQLATAAVKEVAALVRAMKPGSLYSWRGLEGIELSPSTVMAFYLEFYPAKPETRRKTSARKSAKSRDWLNK